MGKVKDPAARIRGAQARAMGEALELAARADLMNQGCIVHRIATPTASRRGRRVFVAQVPGDLFGCTVDGLALLVECKHRTCSSGRTVKPVPSDFEPHQVEALRQWHRQGGIALVAYFDPTKRVQLVPAVTIVGSG